MTPKADIKLEINTLMSDNKVEPITRKHNRVAAYLCGLVTSNEMTAELLYEFCRDEKLSDDPVTYVVDEDVINNIGFKFSKPDNAEQNKFCYQFYKLSAERASGAGCYNYSKRISRKNGALRLQYAELAVDISHGDEKLYLITFKHLLRVLKEQELTEKLYLLLMKHIAIYSSKVKKEARENENKATEEKSATTSHFEYLIQEYETTIKNAHNILDDENINELSSKEMKEKELGVLDILIKRNDDMDNMNISFKNARQHGLFLKARLLISLGKYIEGWKILCEITDKSLPFYNDVIKARAQLVKDHARRIADPTQDVKSPAPFTLPNGDNLAVNFERHHRPEFKWMTSTDKTKLKEEFKTHNNVIEKHLNETSKKIEALQNAANASDKASLAKLIEDKKSLQCLQERLKSEFEGHLPEKRKSYRREVAQARFFAPRKASRKEKILALMDAIIDQRYQITENGSAALPPFILQGYSSRLFIAAENLYQKVVLALNPLTGKYRQTGIPIHRTKQYEYGSREYGPIERYKVGDVVVSMEHIVYVKHDRPGNTFIRELGKYDQIVSYTFNYLSSKTKEKEKQVAALITRFGRSFQAATLVELQRLNPNANSSTLNNFNKACFLICCKEQTQWLTTSSAQYQQGWAVSQARCLTLLEAGYITFDDALRNQALFGVYSQTDLIEKPELVNDACNYIERMHTAYMQAANSADTMDFTKKYLKQDKPPVAMLSRFKARADLKRVHSLATESDSEDEGYETETVKRARKR